MPQPYDTSFVREGRTLAECLVDLVSANGDVRRRAADALQAMRLGLPSVHTDLEDVMGPQPPDDHDKIWERLVREAFASPRFPSRHMVTEMVDRRIGGQEAWTSRFQHGQARHDRLLARIQERIDRATDSKQREREERRWRQALCANAREEQPSDDDAMSMYQLTLGMVFNALDVALLDPPGALERLLAHEHFRREALQAIGRIGPPARERFEDRLIAMAEANDRSEALGALASVQRGDPVLLERAMRWIEEAMQAAAVDPDATITHQGAEGFGEQFYRGDRVWPATHLLIPIGNALPPSAIEKLMELSHSVRPGHRAAAAMVLGYAARDRCDIDLEAILGRLLDLTRDQSWVAGRAIDALGNLRAQPERVVPRLVELFVSFEEFDPDEGYGGAHARVCRALEQFGPDAAVAVPRLVEELKVVDDETTYPRDVLRVLVAVGAAASSAIPTLQRIHDQLVRDQGYEESIREIRDAIERISAAAR